MSDIETDLSDLLLRVAATYDRSMRTVKGAPGQELLRGVSRMSLPLPIGTIARGYGGNGGSAFCPWIGVFDPDINEKPREGLYLAYIFAKDLKSVTLTVQQGAEGLARDLGKTQKAHMRLRANAERLQAAMLQEVLDGWREKPRLGVEKTDWRPTAYQEASIAARRYEIPHLPAEADLRDDLWEAARILQLAAAVDRETWHSDAEEQPPTRTVKKWTEQPPSKRLSGFRPKSDSDYIAHTPERTQVRTRRHETLISEFGKYIQTQGFEANTQVHPRDLMLTTITEEWLVEAKVVTNQNPTKAVREAVGQLFEYRHFFCRESDPHLLALFTEDILTYADYLETLGIGSAWKTPEGWSGSRSAIEWGIVGP
ncbi:MrcB family domain-containing protein [Streptomyces specialis]|uniref:MrcB family domain-containing protein n=1 Tax=Streptomyces specialis TaxID=498367 RepID=UPI00073F8DD4|nr:DUF3578 domain-containing protein [Streptomyces specialis]